MEPSLITTAKSRLRRDAENPCVPASLAVSGDATMEKHTVAKSQIADVPAFPIAAYGLEHAPPSQPDAHLTRTLSHTSHMSTASLRRRRLKRIGSFVLEQWNLFVMGLLILLAYYFPYVGTTGGAVRAEYTVSWGAVGLIFLIAGLSLSPRALLKGIPHYRAHVACNAMCFLLAPALMFAFASGGQAAHLDLFVMAGLVVTGTTPTGIAANVTCTLNAKGSTELASIEVVLGNVIGTFITPLLTELFLSSPQWRQTAPGSHGSVTAIYIRMAKQLSATLFAPLIVGLAIQMRFPGPTARIRSLLKFNKVASFLTTLCVWHNFCKAFYSGAFKTTSPATVIYISFIDCAAYLVLAGAAFIVCRLPGIHTRWAKWWRFSKRDTIALCFCVPAKGVAVGAPLVTILYAGVPIEAQAKLALALLIYNGEHVALSQIMVPVLRWWARDEIEKERLLAIERESGRTTGSDERTERTERTLAGDSLPGPETQALDEEKAVGSTLGIEPRH